MKGTGQTMGARDAVASLISTLQSFFDRNEDLFRQAATDIVEHLRKGGKILIFGNGGSAAEAQHFAAEMTGRFILDRKAIPAIALSSDSPSLTAVGNDMGFEAIFARQVEALGKRGDVAIALTTSGESSNIIAGLIAAKARGLLTLALTGEGGVRLGDDSAVDVLLAVPSRSVPRVQEAHLFVLHLLAEEIEKAFA